MKTAVKERPILFSGPMVRAILDGRKTQTRRVMKTQPNEYSKTDALWRDGKSDLWRNSKQYARDCCPYGQPGDRLWVRETWQRYSNGSGHYEKLWDGEPQDVFYRADESDPNTVPLSGRWRPSIHMPRWASRIMLEITDVRVQRLQEIDARDAWQESVRPDGVSEVAGDGTLDAVEPTSATIDGFRILWEAINGKGSWESNPWVWAITFLRCDDV